MVEIRDCRRKVPCVDCDNKKCWHSGKKESDCPKYKCDRPDEFKLDCEHCAFIDKFIDDMRERNKKHGRKKAEKDTNGRGKESD